jgi:hypothetical protein
LSRKTSSINQFQTELNLARRRGALVRAPAAPQTFVLDAQDVKVMRFGMLKSFPVQQVEDLARNWSANLSRKASSSEIATVTSFR